jgi:hypothetical protein
LAFLNSNFNDIPESFMKHINLILLVGIILCSCEKLDEEILIQIINKDGGSYSKTFEKAIENKLDRRNFIIVHSETEYVLEIEDFNLYDYYDYETVYDDCDYGTNEYELLVEEISGFISLYDRNGLIESWKIDASQSEYVSEGEPLLIEIFSSDDDCEDEGNCDCNDYYVKSPGIFNINSELRTEARKIANDLVDFFSY